jgi:hypothetical protein
LVTMKRSAKAFLAQLPFPFALHFPPLSDYTVFPFPAKTSVVEKTRGGARDKAISAPTNFRNRNLPANRSESGRNIFALLSRKK